MRQTLIAALAATLLIGTGPDARAAGPETFPQSIERGCRGGRAQLYDECGSQMAVFRAAEAEARRTGKVLLVSYGAEWCIWCHVFDKYISGEAGRFDYDLEGDRFSLKESRGSDRDLADDLSRYVEATFVLVHIEAQYSADGDAVLDELDAWDAYYGAIPYIFTVRDGRFAAAMANPDDVPGLETRRDGVFDWYRGYGRRELFHELRRLELAARSPSASLTDH